MVLTEHVLDLPLDHADPGGPSIEVSARELARPEGRDRPLLVFLQGGPGQEAPRPVEPPAWVDRALRDYRVLMLDQRGTGRSTAYGSTARPPTDPAADAAYLRHFRADSIVADAETFRAHLGADRWTVLGQSFGGFCALHYLCAHPDSLAAAVFTGGLPPVGRPTEEIYAATYAAMRTRNAAHHRRYPGDADRLRAALTAAEAGEVVLPGGAPATPRLLRSVGGALGMDHGSERLHFWLERDPRSPAFAHDLATMLPFGGRNPLYAVVHESSYADGVVTGWSAQRTLPDDFADPGSLLLTGEHLFEWHFQDTPGLTAYAEVAERVARHSWPRLYDADVLAAVDVPCAAAVYAEDPFVVRSYSEETAALLPGMRRWLTDEHLHSGLRTSGERVLDRLLGLLHDPV